MITRKIFRKRIVNYKVAIAFTGGILVAVFFAGRFLASKLILAFMAIPF